MPRFAPISHGRRQRGAVLVQAAVALLVCVIAITGTELGYLFFVKREMQKAADLAAVTGARTLAVDSCANASAAAVANANQNLQALGFPVTVTPTCGRFDPAFTSKDKYFDTAGSPFNAINVFVSGTGPTFLPFLSSRLVSAVAVAKSGPPLAGFSVGTKLLVATGNGVLGDTLKMLGLDLTGTSLVGYDGLADVNITPGGLLKQLGIPVASDLTVAGLNALLLANQVTLGQVLDATAVAAGRSDLLALNTTLLNALTTKLGGAGNVNQIKLGSDSSGTSRGLFANVVTPDTSASSALNAQLSALDILKAAVGVASAGHAVTVPSLSLNLLGLATVTAQVAVVEPPSVAFGGVGVSAYTAQVRSYVRVQTTSGLLGSLLAPLVSVDLPIVIDVVTGKGTLAELCTANLRDGAGNDRARITVDSAIAKVCVGNIAASDLFSKSNACNDNLTNPTNPMLNVAGLVQVTQKINLDALPSNGSVTLKEGETQSTTNNLQIGTTVANLVTQLTNQLFGAQPPTSTQLDNLRDEIWNETASVCTATTTVCRGNRLTDANSRVTSNAGNSGLLSGVVNLLGGVVSSLLNPCTGLAYLGGTESGCKQMLRDTLAASSNTTLGSTVNNSLAYLTGLVKPLLNALGSSVLTPLLQNVLGIDLGVTDVHLIKLNCNGDPRLVY